MNKYYFCCFNCNTIIEYKKDENIKEVYCKYCNYHHDIIYFDDGDFNIMEGNN